MNYIEKIRNINIETNLLYAERYFLTEQRNNIIENLFKKFFYRKKLNKIKHDLEKIQLKIEDNLKLSALLFDQQSEKITDYFNKKTSE